MPLEYEISQKSLQNLYASKKLQKKQLIEKLPELIYAHKNNLHYRTKAETLIIRIQYVQRPRPIIGAHLYGN